jgi:hypothetical protein
LSSCIFALIILYYSVIILLIELGKVVIENVPLLLTHQYQVPVLLRQNDSLLDGVQLTLHHKQPRFHPQLLLHAQWTIPHPLMQLDHLAQRKGELELL